MRKKSASATTLIQSIKNDDDTVPQTYIWYMSVHRTNVTVDFDPVKFIRIME